MIPANLNEAVIINEWRGCYKDGWKGLICDEAFAHPAKYSRALIREIYAHVIAEGWVSAGDSVVDPFGGVALGGFDAMQNGLNWYGCELEAKFHGLGNQNIALWNERYSRMPNWGSATLLNGDSRKLASVIREAMAMAVSSPPYAGSINQNDQANDHGARAERKAAAGVDMARSHNRGGPNSVRNRDQKYGDDPGQLGAMKEGDLSLAISSPPFITARQDTTRSHSSAGQTGDVVDRQHTANNVYADETPGQLAAMPEGDLCVSSPPYPQPHTSGGGINVEGYRNDKLRPGSEDKPFDLVGQRTYQGRGGDRAEGNLETLNAEGFDLAVASPPFEDSLDRGVVNKDARRRHARARGISNAEHVTPIDMDSERTQEYGSTEGNIGNMRGGFDAAVSSPPYEHDTEPHGDLRPNDGRQAATIIERDYGATEGNVTASPETFWSASRTILEQLHSVLTPGAHAVFVVKAFVRNKQIVDFPGQWAQLCEAVGFRLIHDHHAMLTEHSGTQGNMLGEDKVIKVERKSFFRRLAESKGSPRIDYENILCFERL